MQRLIAILHKQCRNSTELAISSVMSSLLHAIVSKYARLTPTCFSELKALLEDCCNTAGASAVFRNSLVMLVNRDGGKKISS